MLDIDSKIAALNAEKNGIEEKISKYNEYILKLNDAENDVTSIKNKFNANILEACVAYDLSSGDEWIGKRCDEAGELLKTVNTENESSMSDLEKLLAEIENAKIAIQEELRNSRNKIEDIEAEISSLRQAQNIE